MNQINSNGRLFKIKGAFGFFDCLGGHRMGIDHSGFKIAVSQ